MASVRCFFLRKSLLSGKVWTPMILGTRNALYPDTYMNPISSKEEIDRLEREGHLGTLKVMPVKPAPSTMSDSLYDDPLFKHFTNMVMMWGNRKLARQLMFDTFAVIKRVQLKKYHSAPENERASIELNPLVIFKEAIQNCQPVLALTPIKKGGITYQVPTPITPKKSQWMSMKWLIMAARDKEGEISFIDQLPRELLDAYNREGRVYKRKQDLHKICENNKAYAHYRWS